MRANNSDDAFNRIEEVTTSLVCKAWSRLCGGSKWWPKTAGRLTAPLWVPLWTLVWCLSCVIVFVGSLTYPVWQFPEWVWEGYQEDRKALAERRARKQRALPFKGSISIPVATGAELSIVGRELPIRSARYRTGIHTGSYRIVATDA